MAFPVHACGYNWLESNAKSAKRLAERIKKSIESDADAEGPDGKATTPETSKPGERKMTLCRG